MSDILKRAMAHYAEQPRHEILVPEWGDASGPLKVTWSPLTVRDRERLYAPDGNGKSPTGGEVQIRALIFKACDGDSKKLFDGMAEHDLRHNVDGNVVGRIANAILFEAGLMKETGEAVDGDDQIEAAKNA